MTCILKESYTWKMKSTVVWQIWIHVDILIFQQAQENG